MLLNPNIMKEPAKTKGMPRTSAIATMASKAKALRYDGVFTGSLGFGVGFDRDIGEGGFCSVGEDRLFLEAGLASLLLSVNFSLSGYLRKQYI